MQDPPASESFIDASTVDRSTDSRWSLVQRVAQDESFRRAPRLRELLVFIVENAIEGRTDQLNEYDIARAVFRRPETFHSADDSIVRSSVRQLRTKLHEYFSGPGSHEPVILEVPKGSYVPEFQPRSVLVVDQQVPAAALAAAPTAAGPPKMPLARGVPWKAVAIASSLLVLALAALLVRNSRQKDAPSIAPPPTLVSWLFGNRGGEVNLVLCDSALVVVNAHRPRMLSLDDYIQQRDQEPLPIPNAKSSGATPPEFPGKRLITSFRDMVFVERLGALSADYGFRVALKHSRLAQVRDFRSGNHILLGSGWSNPWTTLFEDQLNFRFVEDATGSFGLANTKPAAGEPGFYYCSPAQAHKGLSYARIAIVPNLSGQDSILLISGVHTESSEGALDAALSPTFLEQVKQITGARKPGDLTGVELLLEVRAVDGVVHDTRLAASRHRSRK